MEHNVSSITDEQFGAEVVDASGPVVVYFWASWCGPCRLMSPIVDWVAKTYPSLKVVKMEVDSNPQAVNKCNVQGVPALALFSAGEPIKSIEGAVNKQQLSEMLATYFSVESEI
jgi:thioredoxin 1